MPLHLAPSGLKHEASAHAAIVTPTHWNVDLTSTTKDKVGEREVVKFQVTGELISGPAKAEEPMPGDPSLRHASSIAGGSQ